MPELPEVETIRSQLEPLLVGATIVDAWAFPSAKFDAAPAAIGGTVSGVARRGKYLLIGLDRCDVAGGEVAEELVVHLGMTGRLSVPGGATGSDRAAHTCAAPSSWAATVTPDRGAVVDAHLRARWHLDDGRVLRFDDVRRFGRIAVVPRGRHDTLATLAALGPEPFDDAFDAVRLRRLVNVSRSAVKTQLLSQRIVAGVGNIYADEALWRARVHPASRRITRAEAAELRDAVREVLLAGIRNGGTTLRDYRDVGGGSGSNQRFLECYGRHGEPCARCGELLRRSVIDARSSVWCPTCQRRRS